MDFLEATIDLSVELVKFVNVDLLSKGDYRVSVEVDSSDNVKSFAQSVSRNEYADKTEVRQSQVAFSKSLEIEFKHSRHALDELVNFQVTFLVDPNQPIESANQVDIRLKLKLWGVAHRISKSYGLRERESMMEPLSERLLSLHVPVQEGLHWATPVLFDFCHRCCVLIVTHAQLWSLSQPKIWRTAQPRNTLSPSLKGYPIQPGGISPSGSESQLIPNGGNHLSTPVVDHQPSESTGLRSNRSSFTDIQVQAGSGGIPSGDIEHVLFGRALLPTDTMAQFDRSRVMNVSKNIFYTLLLAQKSIVNAMHCHSQYFNPQIDPKRHEFEVGSKLRQLMNKVLQCECCDDVVAVVGTNLASLDAENMLLWEEYMRAATVMQCELDSHTDILAPNYTLNAHLFNTHHHTMIQKYGEAFFYSYRQKALAAAFASSEMRQQVCDLLRNHAYLRQLPPFPVECAESQLNTANMPIIFEEIYVENPTDHIQIHVPTSSVSEEEDEGEGQSENLKEHQSRTQSPQSVLAQASLSALNPATTQRHSSPKLSTPVLKSPHGFAKRVVLKSERVALVGGTGVKASEVTSIDDLCSSCRPSTLKRSFSCSSLNTHLLSTNSSESTSNQLSKSRSHHEHKLSLSFQFQGRNSFFSSFNKQNKSDCTLDAVVTPSITVDPSGRSCAHCEDTKSVMEVKSISQARELLLQWTLSSEEETSLKELNPDAKNTLQQASQRAVSPFQAILTGALEVDNVISFLDDVQCSRMEPLLYTPSHLQKFSLLRKEAQTLLMNQKIRLNWYAEMDPFSFACTEPYFLSTPNESAYFMSDESPGCHLVICVHGLDGNCQDLRTLRTFVLMGMKLPLSQIKFLMSRANEDDTMNEGLDSLTRRLVDEVDSYIQGSNVVFSRISFVGHSLGALMIRAALAHVRMHKYHDRLHTFLSLAGPHLGTGYQNSKLVSAGMWVFQKLKKSPAINQLSLKDEVNLEKTFIYRTSTQKGLEYFKNVLLVSSHQDKYVPPHSARIELCEKAVKDDSPFGRSYRTMVDNILSPLITNPELRLVRYDVSFPLSASTTNNLIGRTAHIAVLDSEVWLEKFFTVVALKYFT